MADSKIYTAKRGAIWLQLKPAGVPYYLGCHSIDDIEEAYGDKELRRCYGPDGKFKVIGEIESPPDPITTTLTTNIGKTRDWLEKLLAPATLFIHQRENGRADIFTNYSRVTIIKNMSLTTKTLTGLVHASADASSEHSFEVSAYPPSLSIFKLVTQRISQSELNAINDVKFYQLPDKKAYLLEDLYKYGVAACDAGSGVSANVLISSDSGGSWTASATDPFASDEHIASVVVFPVSGSTVRIMVARGTTDPANPMEIAFSDDQGATWTNVNVGTVNALFAQSPRALFALDLYHIWLVTDGGYVFFSEDGGISWETQDAGVVTIQNLHAVHFSDSNIGFAGGENNALMKTTDGGNIWSSITAPSGHTADTITAVFVSDEEIVWIGYNDGSLYYSEDGGNTWIKSTMSDSGTREIKDLVFIDESIGFVIQNVDTTVGSVTSTTGHLYRTFNGGKDWEEFVAPTNLGLNSVCPINENLAFAAGEVQGGTAFTMIASGG